MIDQIGFWGRCLAPQIFKVDMKKARSSGIRVIQLSNWGCKLINWGPLLGFAPVQLSLVTKSRQLAKKVKNCFKDNFGQWLLCGRGPKPKCNGKNLFWPRNMKTDIFSFFRNVEKSERTNRNCCHVNLAKGLFFYSGNSFHEKNSAASSRFW